MSPDTADSGPQTPPVLDAGATPDTGNPGEDAGEPEADAGHDDDGGATSSVPTRMQALCSARYERAQLDDPNTIRGTWQQHAGQTYQSFDGAYGYPCVGFQYQELPSLDDAGWQPAQDPNEIGFSEASTFCNSGLPAHQVGEFTYFRANVWVPENIALSTLQVSLTGIDDAAKLWIFNSKHPEGYSPADDSACQGNGSLSYDWLPEIVKGEINVIMVVHMDSNCAISGLMFGDILADGASVQTVTCN